MPATTRTPALGYIRVSSYLGRDRGEALTEEVQLEKIQQWCAVADLELVDVLHDIDRSGKDFDSRGRPAFDELLQRLDAGEAGAVVVYRTSRFGRDFYETVRTVRRLREQGIQFHSAQERVDLDSTTGRLLFNIMASFDEYELDVRREYWAETKARVMKQRGVHLGRTPIGYLRASKQPKRECDITLQRAAELLTALGTEREPVSGGLVPDPVAGPAVTEAFAMRACAAPYHDILAMVNRKAPRPHGRLWTHTHVTRMLSLRVYLGEVHQGDLVVPGAHEPLTDPVTFAAAQVLQQGRPRRSPAAEFHLRGLIRCAGCGFPMAGWNQPRTRASGATERVRVYRCSGQRTGGACSSRAVVTADAVEQIVRDIAEPYVRHLKETPPAGGDDPTVAVELARVDERLRRLSGDLQAELDDDVWQETISALSHRRRELRAELARTQPRAAATTSWNDLDVTEQFEVMRAGLGAVIVRKAAYRAQPIAERVRCYPPGSVEHLVPRKENGFVLTPFDFAAAEAAVSAVELAA